jgi:hypothetical protein
MVRWDTGGEDYHLADGSALERLVASELSEHLARTYPSEDFLVAIGTQFDGNQVLAGTPQSIPELKRYIF